MNNSCDEQWFGRKDVFNIENDDHAWVANVEKIKFSKEKNLGCIMVVWWLYCTVHLEEFCYQK